MVEVTQDVPMWQFAVWLLLFFYFGVTAIRNFLQKKSLLFVFFMASLSLANGAFLVFFTFFR